uniref:Uncharacterized protein n=1 Tax=Haptolina brevifila TaxID=156173 RepID=A0A6U7JCK4_9EUKA|mmetsp:Transcript_63402/g.125375  ORF Transcript_63402/g.125375 Transcript_63402/m.125375 type:complete len:203 (+) Transcript_63402:78-686(+)|eukprot:CAMPEP_0174733270 /NCGR_PEP_ID=MMETSP1094-20130205/60960_1 /TAXON_ID=156173 /ORGANISM="Chrysochromulina brevifilum, Strain UTEX LB 985" /LENGTH=202 /DNA_ID=CAMNT_0015935905 /DNA_START=86 /DNA_END=697 /DNA_ORIENTATION=+
MRTTLLLLTLLVHVCDALLMGTRPPPAATHARAALSDVIMGRKGRPKMPAGGGMQGAAAQGAQSRAPEAPSDGTPIFYLYCRTSPGKPWYPVSAMKGDGQSRGLVNAWLNSPFAKGVFKDRLDEGMARSIFDSERRLADMACEQYRQLKDNKARLQWGFKVLSKDVMAKEAAGEIEKVKIVPVNKDMLKGGILDQAKKALGA